MLEKSDVILKHPSPFSIESLLGKTGEEGPCVSVSPPALQTPFLFPQLVPHTQVRPLPPHHTNINPDVFSPQNFPFDLLARGLYQNMTGLIGELFDYFLSWPQLLPGAIFWQVTTAQCLESAGSPGQLTPVSNF